MDGNEKEVDELKKERLAVIIISTIVIIILVLIIVLAIMQNNKRNLPENVVYVYTTQDGTKTNKSERLKEVKIFDGMTVKVTSLTEIDNYTKIIASVLNSTQEVKGGYDIVCVLKDDKGNELARIDGFISTVEAGQSTELNCSIIGAFANAYDISFERK